MKIKIGKLHPNCIELVQLIAEDHLSGAVSLSNAINFLAVEFAGFRSEKVMRRFARECRNRRPRKAQ